MQPPFPPRRGWSAAVVLLWLCLPGLAGAVEIRGGDHVWLDGESVQLRLDLDMGLPPVLEDALANGVTLEFELEARVERARWLGREEVHREARRVQLQYFALNRHYLVTAVADERMGLQPTLGDALELVAHRLGRLPLHGLPEDVRARPEQHAFAVRLTLVYSALPLPLQLDAGLRGDLTTRREWYRWPAD